MEKFNRTANGYDPDEVNAFLDQVINQVEKIVGELKARDARIADLEDELSKTDNLRDKVEQYERMESTLNKALYMAQKTSDQIKNNAYKESELIVEDAKKNVFTYRIVSANAPDIYLTYGKGYEEKTKKLILMTLI